MQMMELVIQNLLLFYFIVTYLGICAGLMITENLLIRRGNRRGLLLLLLEFYLSKKKAWQAGLIPILIVGLCACGLESYMEQQYRGYQIFTDAYPMTNGMTASMTIKQDAERNKLVFSDLEIEDQDGTLRDTDQILIQDETILSRYPSAASWFAKKYALQGDSMPVDFVKDENIFFGGTSISRHAFLRIGALLLLPLLLLYGCMRYLKRQERIRRELKEMGLKFL